MTEQPSQDIMEVVSSLHQQFLAEDLSSRDALRGVEQRYLAKGGLLSGIGRLMSTLTSESKREVGTAVNALREMITATIVAQEAHLREVELTEAEEDERRDLTEALVALDAPSVGSLHLVTQTRQDLEDVFIGMGFMVADGPEVESEWNNFEALNIPRFHPARDAQDSFFLEYGEPETVVLRTHTSPVQVRLMEQGNLPIYAVMPGRVFRRDTADARHTPGFHQIEGLVVDKGITFQDLAGTVATFTTAYFGSGISARLRPAYFPFTEPSAEFEITCTICLGAGCRTCSDTGWIELGGCGMVHPNVFRAVGIDPEEWSGFAFGFGIDRLSQMKYSLADMRVFLDNDVRFLRQFRG